MKSSAKSPAAMLAPGRALTFANVAEGAEGLVGVATNEVPCPPLGVGVPTTCNCGVAPATFTCS